jgi:hypothetical protein
VKNERAYSAYNANTFAGAGTIRKPAATGVTAAPGRVTLRVCGWW